jgi:hypothetical protein
MSFWEYYSQPSQQVSQAYFNAAMIAYGKTLPARTVLDGASSPRFPTYWRWLNVE